MVRTYSENEHKEALLAISQLGSICSDAEYTKRSSRIGIPRRHESSLWRLQARCEEPWRAESNEEYYDRKQRLVSRNMYKDRLIVERD
jgi:hypothetical protein